jgi:hypothetical protein
MEINFSIISATLLLPYAATPPPLPSRHSNTSPSSARHYIPAISLTISIPGSLSFTKYSCKLRIIDREQVNQTYFLNHFAEFISDLEINSFDACKQRNFQIYVPASDSNISKPCNQYIIIYMYRYTYMRMIRY